LEVVLISSYSNPSHQNLQITLFTIHSLLPYLLMIQRNFLVTSRDLNHLDGFIIFDSELRTNYLNSRSDFEVKFGLDIHVWIITAH